MPRCMGSPWCAIVLCAALLAALPAQASFHTLQINELYSSAGLLAATLAALAALRAGPLGPMTRAAAGRRRTPSFPRPSRRTLHRAVGAT